MIKFIREYTFYKSKWFDIIYTDGKYITRVRTCLESELPKTARKYIEGATKREQTIGHYGHGKFQGEGKTEIIYERSEGNGN